MSLDSRSSPHLQVGVKILLRNKAGLFLLLRRNPKLYPDAGSVWDLVGGRITPGQNLLDNLKREIQEETGLKLTQPPQLVAAQDIFKLPDRHIVRLTYVGEIEGEPELSEEHTEARWFSAEELSILPANEIDSFFKELLATKILPL